MVANLKSKWVVELSRSTVAATGMYIHLKIKKHRALFFFIIFYQTTHTKNTMHSMEFTCSSTTSHKNNIVIYYLMLTKFHICGFIKFTQKALKYINASQHNLLNKYINTISSPNSNIYPDQLHQFCIFFLEIFSCYYLQNHKKCIK